MRADDRGILDDGPLAGLPRFVPALIARMGGATRATFTITDSDRQRFEELVGIESVTITIVDDCVSYEVAWFR